MYFPFVLQSNQTLWQLYGAHQRLLTIRTDEGTYGVLQILYCQFLHEK